ncbi:MAG: fructokinase [Alphaproteobacteria bacterium]|jgi:fructokinase
MRIGIDLGGTKTEFIALSAMGDVLVREREATPAGDYRATIDLIRSKVLAIESRLGNRGSVGIGIPGVLSPSTGLVKGGNSTWLNGRRLDFDLAEALGRDVRIANDANCFALSEAVDGAASGAHMVFGVILGTGTGGGLVIGGAPLIGANAIAGEWGHNPLPWHNSNSGDGISQQGRRCWCGKTDCIETWLSGPGFARSYRDLTGRESTPEEILNCAVGGEIAAETVLVNYENLLARALATTINMVDPDVIVLGGGMSNIQRLYHSVPELWQSWAFSDRVGTPLLAPKHGDSSGVRGAAWLWDAP